MSINRSASITPSLFRTAARGARSSQRTHFPTRLQAIAILVPHRAQSTDTSTASSGGANYPPPGFNADQARKDPEEVERKQKQSPEVNNGPGAREQLDKSQDSQAQKKDASSVAANNSPQEVQNLNALAAENAAFEKSEGKKLEAKKKQDKKLTLWQKVKKEVAHYWDGTKLLGAEVKISSKLALKMAAGYELTRRENRQVSSVGSLSKCPLTFCSYNERLWI